MATAALLVAATTRLIGGHATQRARFGIAVSGGPDSMALLMLAADAFPGRVSAATIDHGLRTASAEEASMVARHCATHDIAHVILRPETAISGSLQAAARTARYALLESWRAATGVDWLMTAHHADDQLETLVMRLNRASGLAGLSGIRERQGHVLRPLLGVRRTALLALVTARNIPYVDDPSNHDMMFDRARVRTLLAGTVLLDAVAVAASARHLAQDEAALDWTVKQLSAERLTAGKGRSDIDMAGLPPGLRRRLLIEALVGFGESVPRGEALDRAIDDVSNGISVMLGNSIITPDGMLWTLRHAPARRA